jgi:hypothetical protein
MPSAEPEYAAWVDVMGIGPVMGRSLDIAANFIFKLHIAAVKAMTSDLKLYPVMDGFYVTSSRQQNMLEFLGSVFDQCAEEFIVTPREQFQHRFIVRGALAYGPIIHGQALPAAATQPPHGLDPFSANQGYKSSILIGLPMVQAHLSERKAPPFGLFVHESARSFAPAGSAPLHFSWWKWTQQNNQRWNSLYVELVDYYEKCRSHAMPIEYEEVRIDLHEKMAKQYFR